MSESLTFPELVLASAGLLTLLVAGWCGLVLLIAIVRPSLAAVLVPASLATILGLAPAHADTLDNLHGLPLPDRPTTAAITPAGTEAATARPSDTTETVYRVARGDTLWSIAAHHAPNAHPTNAEINAAVQAWHQANRSVIGNNPDVIRPGQKLTPPTPEEKP